MKRRILSCALCLSMAASLLPPSAITALAVEQAEAYTLEDSYIRVSVARKNGGFIVETVEGDRLKKSDNDKELLYHDGRYDTSFLTLRVGEGAEARDYLFGGSYAESGPLTVTPSAAGDSISAVWSVENLTVTQTVALAGRESNESGMVSLSISVKNENGEAVPVQARLLLDTALGARDFGYYQYTDGFTSTTVSTETVITDVPAQLYASNDLYSPDITAYTVHTGTRPVKAAFGHWSHLAATLFDFEPSVNLDFTKTRNEYLTADSACALYYDLGSVNAGETQSVGTYYGVFSNYDTPSEDRVAVNLTAPVKLSLNEDRTDFVPQVERGLADFSVAVDFTNIATENATPLSNLKLVIRTGGNLRPLTDSGVAANGQSFDSGNPFEIAYESLAVGQSISRTIYFEARPTGEATYEKITIGVYDVSQTQGQLSESYKLGERVAYILLPGTDNDVPKVNFAAMTPKIVYTGGTRHLFVTVSNDSMLGAGKELSARKWRLYVVSEDEKQSYLIPHSNISFNEGVMDVALTEEIELSVGGWYLRLEWDNSVVGNGANHIVPAEYRLQSAPELHFTVSDDKQYKNDSYGVLAVVEYPGTSANLENKIYRIRAFTDEEDFQAYKEDPAGYDTAHYTEYGVYTEIVFVLKGEFAVSKRQRNTGTYYTAISTREMVDGKAVIDNPVVINQCLDFEDGTLAVYYENYESGSYLDSAVCVELDGKLYTNGARTDVWSGKAVFTKLEQNRYNYSLAPYDENGERISIEKNGESLVVGDEENFTDLPICLIWPNRGAIGRTLSGLLFNFAYGQMGIMYDTDGYNRAEEELGTIVSFAAALDLTFARGKTEYADYAPGPDTYWSKLQEVWATYRDRDTPYAFAEQFDRAYRSLDWSQIDESGEDWREKEASASVMVRDVIFGCGEGFVGVNFSVGVAITNYVSGLPEIQGTISVNTINNWAFGIDGKIDLKAFYVEAKVSFRSKNNVPVPDELYVFVSGFEPGINIDGFGVVWLTGGGGGIKNLYDSIFATKKVPPLKLLLSVSFDLLKILECEKATLSLGLTGISLNANGIGVKGVDGLKVIDRIGLSLEWYPGMELQAYINLNLLQGLISGGGYIVLMSADYKDFFFEIFARASLNVPNSIPIVGGMRIGGVDLGINSEKIWGAVEVLFITLGLTYYWGEGGVDFTSGNKAQPTFPELLGYESIPVGYDEETDRTLYVRVGTNTTLMASNLPDDGGLVLMNTTGAFVRSNGEKRVHQINFGTVRGDNDALVQVTFDAASLADAREKARGITVGSTEGGNDYGLELYDGTNLETANANVTYDEGTGKATYAFTAVEDDQYGRTWYLSTPTAGDILLYHVEPIPEVTDVSGGLNGDRLTLAWNGTELAELDQISFYLTADDAGRNDPEGAVESGYRIGTVTEQLGSGSAVLSLPADIPTGDYYIRAVYAKDNEVNGTVYSSGEKLHWVNDKTPGAVNITAVRTVGDLQYELTIAPDGNTDGYLVTVYDEQGAATDFEQVSFAAAAQGDTVITVGGSYETADPENSQQTRRFGLRGGECYRIGVTPYQTVETEKNGVEGETAVRGREVLTELILLPEMVTPTVTFTSDRTAQTRTRITYQRVTRKVRDENTGEWILEYVKNADGSYQVKEVSREEETVFTARTLTITAAFSEAVTGQWKIDGKEGVAFQGVSVPIALAELEEGSHTLTVEGSAADGDGFYATYVFTVDTLPPQLLLSSPVNGAFFGKNGTLTLTGVTDADARLLVTCDGEVICEGKTVEELGGTMASDGVFSVTLNLPDPNRSSRRTVGIAVCDDVGNSSVPETATLSHGGLADLRSLEITVDGRQYQYGNLPVPAAGLTAELELVGVMSDGSRFPIDGENVTWDILTVKGKASEVNGRLTVSAQSQGVITGKLAVADGSFRTASICFGANGEHIVSVSATMGGQVVGGGEYAPNTTVILTAVPDSGYRFAGWSLDGVDVTDLYAETITFTMPERGNVTAMARFEPIPASSAEQSVYAAAGTEQRIKIPAWKTARAYLPYYTDSTGKRSFVPVADEVEGEMVFIAPVTAFYRFGENPVTFADLPEGFWATEDITFCAERELFNGVGDDCFAPAGTMNRAMFVTVLYRLAGSPAVSGTAEFTDVKDGEWYTNAVIWAKSVGVINGYDDGRFGIEDDVSREQMCTMLTRYWKQAGYELPAVKRSKQFTDQAAISEWAEEGVAYCQSRGWINGYPDGSFLPQGNATRAENSAVLHRVIRSLFAPVEAEPVRIAFLDSGISVGHLNSAQVEAGRNLVFDDWDTTDRVGHGTATAGLVLGSEEFGLEGLCPSAVVVPLVCYDKSPTGEVVRSDHEGMARAIYAAVDTDQCDIINISMGTTVDDPVFRQAVEYALSRGVLVISAVGNDYLTEPDRVYYPAAYEGVIGVGAADGGQVADFSQRSNVDVLARGVGLETVTNKNAAVTEQRDGTSYACAVVSGLCAKLWTEQPELTAAEVMRLLFESATDIGVPGFDVDSGWGIVK